MNIKEATKEWVGTMNAFPYELIARAYPHMDGLEELTPVPTKWECNTCSEEFSQEEVDELKEKGHCNRHDDIICPTCYNKEKEDFEDVTGSVDCDYDEGDEDKLEYDGDNEGEVKYELDNCVSYIEEVEDYDNQEFGLPMWGWLWNPENIDEDWIRNNLEKVANCGFRIYESDEVGIMIGIDGAGYDFYDAHWIPLYKARGLRWHDES